MKKVYTPKWWDNGKRHIGYTDGVDTFCCEMQPSWFVKVPAMDYTGYFLKKDLRIIGNLGIKN